MSQPPPPPSSAEGTAAEPGGPALDESIAAILAASTAPIIAVDLDDVLSQTHRMITEWHNETYGTDMDLSHFYYYHLWKNPYWGPPAETMAKVRALYKSGVPHRGPPVPGAAEGTRALRALGYRLVVVTAREPHEVEVTNAWLDAHFPGVFDSVVCTGWKNEAIVGGAQQVFTKLSKHEVCSALGAAALIDDARENLLACVRAEPPVRALLFGGYEWGKRTSVVRPAGDGDDGDVDVTRMSYAERLAHEGGRAFWVDDEGSAASAVPPGAPFWAVREHLHCESDLQLCLLPPSLTPSRLPHRVCMVQQACGNDTSDALRVRRLMQLSHKIVNISGPLVL